MGRVKLIAIVLFVLNFVFMFRNKDEYGSMRTNTLSAEIINIEREIAYLQECAEWTVRAETAIASPPSAYPSNIMAQIRNSAVDFQIEEMKNEEGCLAKITISGKGKYFSIYPVFSVLGRKPAVVVERISIEACENELVKAKIEALVRDGEWNGDDAKGKSPEPLPEPPPIDVFGTVDIFYSHIFVPPPIQSVVVPAILYLGYYAEKSTPTVILEENGKTVLAKVGERSPAGSLILSATENEIEFSDERGSTWTVQLKKAP